MTYNVFGGTLSLTQSINQSINQSVCQCICICVWQISSNWVVFLYVCMCDYVSVCVNVLQNGICPLHVSSKWGRTSVVTLLLDNNADIDCRTRVCISVISLCFWSLLSADYVTVVKCLDFATVTRLLELAQNTGECRLADKLIAVMYLLIVNVFVNCIKHGSLKLFAGSRNQSLLT